MVERIKEEGGRMMSQACYIIHRLHLLSSHRLPSGTGFSQMPEALGSDAAAFAGHFGAGAGHIEASPERMKSLSSDVCTSFQV
jgi:hypothetical protein